MTDQPSKELLQRKQQIKHMVNRFLGWRLPENFNPDAGISFKATYNEHCSFGPMKHEPTGTNLFDATQAEEMVRYMLAELPDTAADLRQQNAALVSALRKYGHHRNSCMGFPASSEEQLARDCTCGFQIALAPYAPAEEAQGKLASGTEEEE